MFYQPLSASCVHSPSPHFPPPGCVRARGDIVAEGTLWSPGSTGIKHLRHYMHMCRKTVGPLKDSNVTDAVVASQFSTSQWWVATNVWNPTNAIHHNMKGLSWKHMYFVLVTYVKNKLNTWSECIQVRSVRKGLQWYTYPPITTFPPFLGWTPFF